MDGCRAGRPLFSVKPACVLLIKLLPSHFYSPSPEYPAACSRDERQGEPRRSSEAQRSVGGLKLRRNSAWIRRSWLRGALLSRRNYTGSRRGIAMPFRNRAGRGRRQPEPCPASAQKPERSKIRHGLGGVWQFRFKAPGVQSSKRDGLSGQKCRAPHPKKVDNNTCF